MDKIVLHLAALMTIAGQAAGAQTPSSSSSQPIIDMHLHAYLLEPADGHWPFHRMCVNDAKPCNNGPSTYSGGGDYLLRGTVDMMKKHNVVLGFLIGDIAEIARWNAAAPGRFIRSAGVYDGLTVSVDSIRKAYAEGRIQAIGEIGAQYDGIPANDARLEPYFAAAESLDVPVLIHTAGIGSREPAFRSYNGRPLLLEDVLDRHPKLRLYVENAGYPYLDDMIALMYQHPYLYVDVSTITWLIPRDAFHDYLRALVRAGFGKRIMFGSDQLYWPEVIGDGIESIQSASFLTHEEKRDILYNNAVRFLRLSSTNVHAAIRPSSRPPRLPPD